ncbi:MAG: hypothetical protein WBW81_01175 [Methylocella sp.]
MNGYGVLTLAKDKGKRKGDRYEGEFLDGTYNGYGVYTYANGYRYDGEWRNGKWAGHNNKKAGSHIRHGGLHRRESLSAANSDSRRGSRPVRIGHVYIGSNVYIGGRPVRAHLDKKTETK